MKSSHFVGAALLALSLCLSGGVAHADTQRPMGEAPVSYADLDLTQADDARELHWRLARAARAVCGRSSAHTMAMKRAYRACYRDTLANAVERMDRPSPRLARFDR